MLKRIDPDAAVARATPQATPSTAAKLVLVGPVMQSNTLVVVDSGLPARITPPVLTVADVLRDFDRYAAWANATAVTLGDTKVDALYRAILASRDVAPFTAPAPAGNSDTIAIVLAALAKHPLGGQAALNNAATLIAEAYNAIAEVETTHDAAAMVSSRGWLGSFFVGKETKADEKAVADAFATARTAHGNKVASAVYAISAFEQLVNTYLTSTQLLPSVALRTRVTERTELIDSCQQRIGELTRIKELLTQQGEHVVYYARQGDTEPAAYLISNRQSYLVRFEAVDLQLGAIMNTLADHVGAEVLGGVMPEFGPLQGNERLQNPADLKGAHGWCVEGAAICDRSIKALNEVLVELNVAQARDQADQQRFSTVERQVVRAAAIADV